MNTIKKILLIIIIGLILLGSLWIIGTWEFQESQIALILSVISLALAGTAIWWNIYSHYYTKPILKLSFQLYHEVDTKFKTSKKYLVLTATNFGPDEITIGRITLRRFTIKTILRKKRTSYFFGRGFYKDNIIEEDITLKKGARHQYFLNYNKVCIFGINANQIGVYDHFDRSTWVKLKTYKNLKEKYIKEFPDYKKLEKEWMK